MPDEASKCKPGGATFVRFYSSDWRSGCIGLTLEQEGLYWRICAHYYETGIRLPLDDKEAAHRLGLNPKNYRRVRDQLLAKGKITRHDDGYSNARAERELRKATRTAAENHTQEVGMGASRNGPDPQHADRGGALSGRGAAGQDRETTADQSAINPGLIADQSGILSQKSEEILRANKEPVTKSQELRAIAVRERAGAALPEIDDLKNLSDRLHDVAAPALASPAIAPGLFAMTVPQMWLDQGCDLERDIVPVIRAQVAKGRKSVRSWDYFTPMVAEARAKRLAGLPAVPLQQPSKPLDREADSNARYLERLAKARMAVGPAQPVRFVDA